MWVESRFAAGGIFARISNGGDLAELELLVSFGLIAIIRRQLLKQVGLCAGL